MLNFCPMTMQEISVFRKGSSNPSLHAINLANNLTNLISTIKILDYSEEKKKKEKNLLALSIVIKKILLCIPYNV